MPTLKVARRALLQRHQEDLGIIRPITALATGSVTVGSLANTNLPDTKYRNTILGRFDAASAADNIRYAGLLTASTGLIAHTGSNYSDTTATDEQLEIWYDPDIRPDVDILNVFSEALDELRVLCHVPLGHGPDDYDMQANNTTSWPDTSNVTMTAQTTAAQVLRGARSKNSAFSAAGYSQSTLVRVHPSGQVFFWGIWKADVGTISLDLRNAAGTQIDVIDYTGETWALGQKLVSAGSSDEEVRLRLAGSAASDEGDHQAAVIVIPERRLFILPSWIGDKHMVIGLSVARSTGPTLGNDLTLAEGLEYASLRPNIDYRFYRPYADANPYQVEILNPYYMTQPLFIDVACPYSEPYGVSVAFSAESDTTDCPLDLLIAQSEIIMAERWPRKFSAWLEYARAQKSAIVRRRHVYSPARPQLMVNRAFS
jgi:hypothetical protein